MNWKVPGSNPSRCSDRFRDPNLLWGFISSHFPQKTLNIFSSIIMGWFLAYFAFDNKFHKKRSKIFGGFLIILFPSYLISKRTSWMQGIAWLYFQLFTKVRVCTMGCTSTPDPKLPGFNPTDAQGWTLATNLIVMVSRFILINIK